MKWAEARRIGDKKRALHEALSGRTVEEAAELLGLSPRHLYRVKRQLLGDETDVTGMTFETAVAEVTAMTAGQDDMDVTEREDMTATVGKSLSYGSHKPSFAPVDAMATVAGEGVMEDTRLQLPRDVKEYLQVRAIRNRERGHLSLSREVVEIIRREMEREGAQGSDE